jgi:hypothetical protein
LQGTSLCRSILDGSRFVAEKIKTEVKRHKESTTELPTILVDQHTSTAEAHVENSYRWFADMFERWVMRRQRQHTQRAYRQDVVGFVSLFGIRWPHESSRLFKLSVTEERTKVVAELEAAQAATLDRTYQQRFLGGAASG